jgi:hypothetical protein
MKISNKDLFSLAKLFPKMEIKFFIYLFFFPNNNYGDSFVIERELERTVNVILQSFQIVQRS